MKFEPKISGVKVTDFEIEPIFDSQFISLEDCIKADLKQEVMNFILDKLRFYRGDKKEGETVTPWYCVMDYDTIYKLSVLQNYPQYEQELKNYFGDNWLKYYIRFGH